MDTVKHICIVENTTTVSLKKNKPPPKKRAITSTKTWDFPTTGLTLLYQLSLLGECFSKKRLVLTLTSDSTTESTSDSSTSTNEGTNIDVSRVRVLEQLIHSKWYGYRAQDIEKHILDTTKLVSENTIVQLLTDSRLLCFYCRKSVQLFYEFIRESSQWTLDRIDNTYGHNADNVVIACLGCNLRRKTMYYERFVMTKQMTITKTGSDS